MTEGKSNPAQMEKTAQAAWNARVRLGDGALTSVIIHVGVGGWVGEHGGGHALIYKLIHMSHTITVGVR